MNAKEFVTMTAGLSATGDKRSADGEKWPSGYVHDAGDAIATLDDLIEMAREIVKDAEYAPNRNFVEGNWSFRRKTIMRGKEIHGIGFDIYPKGERSHWSKGASIEQSGSCWIVHPRSGHTDAFPSWAEAKAHALTLIGQGGL